MRRAGQQLKRFNDNTTVDILAVGPGGLADATAHEKFCAGAGAPALPADRSGGYPTRAACVVSVIYDQTPNGNHL